MFQRKKVIQNVIKQSVNIFVRLQLLVVVFKFIFSPQRHQDTKINMSEIYT